MRPSSKRTRCTLAVLPLVLLVGACTSTSDPADPGDPATITLSLSPNSATVEQGGSTTFDGTATLGGTFSGTVSITVTGLPSGVTVTVGDVTTSGNTASATVTIEVEGSVAAGSYSGTVTASGSGVSATAGYTLVVTAAPAYSISASPSPISVRRGQSGDVQITLTRTNFTESVALGAEGVPASVTATFDPDATVETASVLTLAVGAGAALGTTTITVRGTSSLADVTATFDLTVTDPDPPTGLAVDFSTCDPGDIPVWVAIADGLGAPWTVAPGSGDVYDLSGLTQDILGITVVLDGGSTTDVSVDYLDVSELSGTIDACPPDPLKLVNGAVAQSVGTTNVSLGPTTSVVGVDGPFDIAGVIDGPLPLVAYSRNSGAGSDEMIIERNLDIPDNGSVGVLNFSDFGIALDQATITPTGVGPGATGFVGVDYAVTLPNGTCSVAPLYVDFLSGPFVAQGPTPTDHQSGEFYVAGVSLVDGAGTLAVKEAFATLADASLALPTPIPMPTLTDVTGGGNYLRLQADFTLPSEYDQVTFFDYTGTTASMTVYAAGGVLSGAVTLTMPDFSALAGWDDAWAVPSGATNVDYVVGGGSGQDIQGLSGDALCFDGGRLVNGTYIGVYN